MTGRLPDKADINSEAELTSITGGEPFLAGMQWMRLLQVAIDACIIAAALAAAFLIRFDGKLSAVFLHQLLMFMPVLVPLRLLCNRLCGVYRRLWRYTGLAETVELFGSILIVTAILMVLRAFGKLPVDGQQLSYGVILTEPTVSFLLLAAARVARRMQTEHEQRRHWRQPVKKRALVVGAGDAGQMVVRELAQRPDVGVDVVGLIDDDPLKLHRRIGRLTVYGTTAQLARLVEDLFVDQVIIAIPSAPASEIRRIVDICRSCEVETRILPGLFELIDGRVSISQLREVSLQDLLGREPVELDSASIAEYIEGKRVLVTGAGGSIGSELCRQIMRFQPEELILLGRGENSIFMVHEELKRRPEPVRLSLVIADVRDRTRMSNVFLKHRPHVVFHAAAHKHVPLMELNASEAVTNNIFGTQNVALLSEEHGVERFVLVSSDKAVHPTSIMGATKRIAEMLVQDLASRGARTKFVAVRFGNVLDSRGSVLPIWRQQIAAGGPVTVTHKDATRYFMLIPEAVQLIMQAGAIAAAGDIFVLDMGKPIKIADLAEDLIKLSGLRPGQDIKIDFVGLRPGEKLHEELLTAEEGLTKTMHRKILVGKPQAIDHARLTDDLKTLMRAADVEDESTIRRSLSGLVGGNLLHKAVH